MLKKNLFYISALSFGALTAFAGAMPQLSPAMIQAEIARLQAQLAYEQVAIPAQIAQLQAIPSPSPSPSGR